MQDFRFSCNYPKGLSDQFPCQGHPPLNVVQRLQRRQTFIGTASQSYRLERSLYQCIVPNYTESGLLTPSGYLRKFSPDGRLLIGFSWDQRSLDIYEFFGSGAGLKLYSERMETQRLRRKLFGQYFRHRHSVHVPNDLNRECSLFTLDSRYVIVGSSTSMGDAPFPHMYDVLRNNEGIPPTDRSPVEDCALYLIDLHVGVITDTILYRFDKIYLAHNQGLSLCGSTLAVLSVQHQTIHLYLVDDGTFTHLQDIGEFCHPDDSLIYNDVRFTGSDSEDEDADSLVLHPYHNKWFNSLKHRLLCWILSKAESECTASNRLPLANYYERFVKYASLRLWKLQLMSENTLLLKYADEDIVSMKQQDPTSQPAIFAFYDIQSANILAVYDNASEDLLRLFENYSDDFRAPVSHPLSRDVSSVSNNLHARALHEKFKQTITSAKFGGHKEATRRLLGQLPVSSQCLSSSPYLDLSLFSYDDKWVSPIERPKPCGDNPVK